VTFNSKEKTHTRARVRACVCVCQASNLNGCGDIKSKLFKILFSVFKLCKTLRFVKNLQTYAQWIYLHFTLIGF